ncbi:hypothetical protein [Marinilabilia sp.]|nr:hypothetical protein [Marinilabilia sp.]
MVFGVNEVILLVKAPVEEVIPSSVWLSEVVGEPEVFQQTP